MRAGLFVILALASTAAVAQEAKPEDAGKKDKLICRVENDLGTRLSGARVCMTRDQWSERRRRDRETAERNQRGQVNRSGG